MFEILFEIFSCYSPSPRLTVPFPMDLSFFLVFHQDCTTIRQSSSQQVKHLYTFSFTASRCGRVFDNAPGSTRK
jgi:hypothetical protein